MSEATLYERLGGGDAVRKIVNEVLDRHLENPTIATRFEHADMERGRVKALEFFSMGLGGPVEYTGKSMLEAHAGMNISDEEFVAVLDDILATLDANDVGQREREEILAIAYSLKAEIVRR